MEENKWDAVLIAVQDEARSFFCGFRVNHAAELYALLIGAPRARLHMLFLIGDDSNCPSADTSIAAKQRLSIFGAIFLEFAGIHDSRNDFAHVVLLGGIAGKDSVDFVGRVKRIAGLRMAERRSAGSAYFVGERANTLDAGIVVGFAKIHGAANLRMHFCAAKLLSGGLLTDRGLHQCRSGKKQS